MIDSHTRHYYNITTVTDDDGHPIEGIANKCMYIRLTNLIVMMEPSQVFGQELISLLLQNANKIRCYYSLFVYNMD